MKVSIITPVYNTAPYLDRCIESLINQSHKDIEIILVDDGSLDNSRQVCKYWQEKDSRIIYLYKENGGQASARNVALSQATGDYICFVDSDDCIAPDYIARLLDICQSNHLKISMCGYTVVDGNTPVDMIEIPQQQYSTEIISPYDYFSRIYTTMEIAHVVIWNKMYHRSIFESLRFSEGHIYEDEGIIHHLINECENIGVYFQPLYFYTVREGSTMTPDKFNPKHFDILAFWQERMEYFKIRGWYDLVYFTMKNYLVKCLELYNFIDDNIPEGKAYRNHLMKIYRIMLDDMKKNPVKSKKFVIQMEYYNLFPKKFNGTDRRQFLFGN